MGLGVRGFRLDKDAVSSVVGTVLVLGITITVFGGLSVVVVDYFAERQEQTRADVGVAKSDQAYLLTHRGGESIHFGAARVSANIGGIETDLTQWVVANHAASWLAGNSVCIAGNDAGCYAPAGTDVRGVLVVFGNAVVVDEGERGLPLSTSTGSSSGSGQPDLVVAFVGMSPSAPGAGQSMTFTARVTNQGNGTAAASSLLFSFGSFSSTRPVSALAAGVSQNITSTGWTAVAGNHVLALTADSAGVVAESNELNNAASQPFTVAQGIADPGQPFEDGNGDGVYDPVNDTLISPSLVTDCNHSSNKGLVIPASVGPITAATCSFSANDDITLGVSLITTSGNLQITADDITVLPGVTLQSQNLLYLVPSEDFVGDGATFRAGGPLRIGSTSPGQLGITASLVGAVLDNDNTGNEIQVHVDSGGIDARNATFLSSGLITIGGANSGHTAGNVILDGAFLDNDNSGNAIRTQFVAGSISAIGVEVDSTGAIELAAGTSLNVANARLDNDNAGNQIYLSAGTTLNASGLDADATGKIDLEAGGAIVAVGANLDNAGSGNMIELDSGSTIDLAQAVLASTGAIDIDSAGLITLTNAILSTAGNAIRIDATPGAVSGEHVTMTNTAGVDVTGVGIDLDYGCIQTTGGSGNVVLAAGSGVLSFQGPSQVPTCAGLLAAGSITGTGASILLNAATINATGTSNDIRFGGTSFCSGGSTASLAAAATRISSQGQVCLHSASGGLNAAGACIVAGASGASGKALTMAAGTGVLTATGPAPVGCVTDTWCTAGGFLATGAITLTSTGSVVNATQINLAGACFHSSGSTLTATVTTQGGMNWANGKFRAPGNIVVTTPSDTNRLNVTGLVAGTSVQDPNNSIDVNGTPTTKCYPNPPANTVCH